MDLVFRKPVHHLASELIIVAVDDDTTGIAFHDVIKILRQRFKGFVRRREHGEVSVVELISHVGKQRGDERAGRICEEKVVQFLDEEFRLAFERVDIEKDRLKRTVAFVRRRVRQHTLVVIAVRG